VGPGFALTNAKSGDFLLHYVEWLTQSALGSAAALPVNNGPSYHLGSYAVSDGEIWLNPLSAGITDTNWKLNGEAAYTASIERNPSTTIPGYIGDVIYYPQFEGQYKTSQSALLNSQIYDDFLTDKKSEVTAYETAKTAYDALKTTYN